jgi:hypothetical protein
MKKSIVLGLLLMLCVTRASAQIYLEQIGFNGGIILFDLCTCAGEIVDQIGTSAIAASSNGNPVYLNNDEITEYDTLTGTSTVLGPMPGGGNNLVVAENGLIYQVGILPDGSASFLSVLDPLTGIFTDLGTLPPGIFSGGDLFFYGGNLYMAGFSGTDNGIFEIPIFNPGATTFTFPLPLSNVIGTASFYVNGVQTVYFSGNEGGNDGIFKLDMATGAYELVCSTTPNVVFDMGAWSGMQVAACCANDAGNLQSLSLVTACANQNITLTHLGNEVLGQGESLSFILTADSTANLPSDILQISATPTFFFDENTMTPNTVYYVAAVAAPGPPGAPDWVNGCYSLSFWAKVRWRPLPSVSFSPPQNEICAGGCQNLELSFTGSPPFNLTFQTSSSGSQSQTFFQNTGLLPVCPPAGFVGELNIQATNLVDAFCTCSP